MKRPAAILLSALLLVAGSVGARAGLQAEPAAIDLGRRQQEQTVSFEVKLTNDGKEPLEILSVTADCSCTVAEPGKRKLAPGETTPLLVGVETRGYIGRLHRKVLVQSSAGELTLPIDLSVSLFKNWSLEPSTIVMTPSPKGQSAELRATLQYIGEGQAKLGEIACTPDWLQAVAQSDDGKTYALRFVKPASAPAGNYSVKVVVATTAAEEPSISFNVFVPITSALRVTPNPVVLPTVKAGQSSMREMIIQGWSAADAPRFELTHGQIKLLQRADGKVTCEIAVQPPAPGPLTQLLRIYDGDKLEAEIPVIVRAEPNGEAKP